MFQIGPVDLNRLGQTAASAAGAAAAAAGAAASTAAAAVTTVAGAATAAATAAGQAAGQAAASGALAASKAAEALAAEGGLLDNPVSRGIGAVTGFVNDRVSDVLALGYGLVEGPELREMRGRAAAANSGEPAQRRTTEEDHQHLATISEHIYASDNPDTPGVSAERLAALEAAGYSKVEDPGIGPLEDPSTGLEAEVWQRVDPDTGEKTYILVFEGTQGGEDPAFSVAGQNVGNDWGANFQNALGLGVPRQHEQALDLALQFKEKYGSEDANLVVTGHSLGGGLATFAGVGAGVETVTFSPSGLGPASKAYLHSMGLVDRNEHLVKNYVHRGEVLNILRAGSSFLLGAYAESAGHLIMVGEVQRYGSYEHSDPIAAHNDLASDLSE